MYDCRKAYMPFDYKRRFDFVIGYYCCWFHQYYQPKTAHQKVSPIKFAQ